MKSLKLSLLLKILILAVGLAAITNQAQAREHKGDAGDEAYWSQVPNKQIYSWNSYEECYKAIQSVDLCVKFARLSGVLPLEDLDQISWNSYEECYKAIQSVDLCVKFARLSEAPNFDLKKYSWNSYDECYKAIQSVDLCAQFGALGRNLSELSIPGTCGNDAHKWCAGKGDGVSGAACLTKHKSVLSPQCSAAFGFSPAGTTNQYVGVDQTTGNYSSGSGLVR